MKFKILLFIFVCCVSSSLADIENDCTVKIIDGDETIINWVTNSLDIYVSDTDYDYTVDITYENNFAIQDLTGDASTYVTFTPDEANSKITLSLSDAFKTLETDYKDKDPISAFISAQASFICNEESTVVFIRLYVTDINNNLPIFTESTYEYNLPVPLSPKLDLSSVGTTISATDIDLSNNAITFTSDSPDFELESTLVSGKTFKASLKATKYVTYNEDYSFKIWAYDKENKTSAEPATITIKIDTDNSFSTPPTFENPLYKFDYNETEGTPSFIPSDGLTITVNTINSENTKVELDDETYFTALYDQTTNEVTLTPTGTLIPATSSSVLTFTLTVSVNEESSGTIILVSLPDDKVITVPKFKSSYYLSSYTVNPGEDDDVVELNSEISATEGAEITLSDNDNFAIDPDNYSQLKVLKDLNETAINSGEDIFLTLTATIKDDDTDYSSEATVIIQMPTVEVIASPKFTQVYYYGEIQDDDTVKLDAEIDAISGTETVEISFDDSNDYLTIAKNSDNKWVVSRTSTALPSDSTEIIATLKAEIPDKSVDPGYATLVVTIPAAPTIASPKFTQVYYSGEIQDDDTVKLDAEIDASSGTETVEISFDRSNDYLTIAKNTDNKWVVTRTSTALPSDVTEIIATLKAEIPDKSVDPGYATLVVPIPTTTNPAPKFSSPYYTATYKIVSGDDNDEVELQTNITVTVDDGSTPEVLLSETSENFELVESDEGYTITVIKNLNDSVLIGEASIILSLKAMVDNADDGLATVVIELPKEIAPPSFTQAVYQAEYKTGTDTDTVTLSSDIEQTGSYLSESHIELITPDDYKTNFKLSESAPYEITVEEKLGTDVLQSQQEIILTLKATLDGSSLTTTSIVVVQLPEIPAAPKFIKPLYTAKYESGTVTVDDPQILTDASDQNSVTISLETYSENFEVKYDDSKKSFQFTVSEELDDSDSEIYVILNATIDGAIDHNTATVAIRMAEKTENVIPEFSKSYYEATYNHTDGGTDTITMGVDPITITSDHASETTVKVIGTYQANFDIELSDDSWILTLLTPLDSETLNGYEIIVELEASLTDSSKTGKAVVVVNLQNSDKLDAAPRFNKALYEAEYTTDGSINLSETISIISNREESVIVTLTSFDTNFLITRDSDKKIWNLTQGDPLTDEDLKTNKELTIVLNAHLDNSVADGSATLKVTLPEQTLEFNQAYYHATYLEDNSLKVDETISVTKGAKVEIISDYGDSFAITCDETCTLTVETELSTEVLASETEIILVLQASRSDIAETSEATVIIALPLQESAKAPEFTQAIYVAVFNEDETITIQDPQIQINGLTDITEVTVTLDGTYKDYFNITLKTDHWELTDNKLPKDVIDEEISIQLTLVATKTDVSVPGKTAVVIQLPKKTTTDVIHFASNAYLADYNQETKVLTVTNDIIVEGDDDGTATITLSGENSDLFSTTYADSKVTLKVIDEIPQEIIDSNIAISIDIIAKKDSATATTTVVIRLPQTETDALSFAEVTYVASYKEVDGDANDEVELENGPIQINGETDVTKIELTIEDSDFQKYFSLTGETDHWTINVNDDYPTDGDEVSLLLTLLATKDTTQGKVGVVIKLPRKETTKSFNFNQHVYTGDYMIENEEGKLTVDETITIIADVLDDISIELAGDYKEYFKQTYDSGVVTIESDGNLPDDVVNDQVAVTVNIIATRNDETDSATLVVTLPKKLTPTTIYFKNNIYLADYKIENNNPKFTLQNQISLEGGADDVKLTLSGDYEDNFDVKYSDGTISMTLSKALDNDVIDSETAITLDIIAELKDETTKTSVVVKLPKADSDSSDDKTGLIAAVSVLAVLLVAALVGSAVFYYFKFRRSNDYSNMEDSRPSERFRKNSQTEGKHKIEHPTRRATGIVKYPLGEVVDETPDGESDFNLEKRKSVQFDTINVDELKIEKTDDVESDFDHLDVEGDTGGDADERRSSRV